MIKSLWNTLIYTERLLKTFQPSGRALGNTFLCSSLSPLIPLYVRLLASDSPLVLCASYPSCFNQYHFIPLDKPFKNSSICAKVKWNNVDNQNIWSQNLPQLVTRNMTWRLPSNSWSKSRKTEKVNYLSVAWTLLTSPYTFFLFQIEIIRVWGYNFRLEYLTSMH